jgi:hypothetical protein
MLWWPRSSQLNLPNNIRRRVQQKQLCAILQFFSSWFCFRWKHSHNSLFSPTRLVKLSPLYILLSGCRRRPPDMEDSSEYLDIVTYWKSSRGQRKRSDAPARGLSGRIAVSHRKQDSESAVCTGVHKDSTRVFFPLAFIQLKSSLRSSFRILSHFCDNCFFIMFTVFLYWR